MGRQQYVNIPGRVLASGAVLVTKCERLNSSSGHHHWTLRCVCGDLFRGSSTHFNQPWTLCPKCAPGKRRELVGRRCNADLYFVGMQIAGVVLLEQLPANDYRRKLWRVRCETCSDEFNATSQALANSKIACRDCRVVAQRLRMTSVQPRGCKVCEKMPHRVEGRRCRGCGLEYRELAPIHAVAVIGSSAAKALSGAA